MGSLVERRMLCEGPPVKVIFVTPGVPHAGSMIFAVRQAQALREAGVAVHMFHLASRTSPIRLLREWLRFRADSKRIRPQVVHAQFGTVTALFAALARGSAQLVITFRGGDLNPRGSRPLRHWVGRVLSQIAAPFAAQVICVSEELKQRLWWSSERVTVLPSGVDTRIFRPISREEARRALNWNPDDRVVLFNAGFDPANKRLDLARAAVEKAGKILPQVRLAILDGFVDPISVPLWMNAADCVLVTSDSEGSPSVVQEAIACGLPVVSVETGDVRQRIEGLAHCRLVPRDAHQIGTALADTLSSGARYDGTAQVSEISFAALSLKMKQIYAEAAR